MPVRAVLFDFDGVIADTENVHIAAWERTFHLMARDVPPEVCARAAEEDDARFLESVLAEAGVEDADIDGWVARKQAFALGMLRDAPRVHPGVRDLVERLAPEATLAVVSGTWRANVEAVLDASGLRERFPLIIAKEDVARPKPDPRCYRLALERLKVPAARAVALEDSPSGIAAARGAGVRVVAVGHRRDRGEWCEGLPYVRMLSDLDSALEAIG